MKRTLGVLAALLMSGSAVMADESPRDRLIDLATVEITHELCRFPLSDAQQEIINAARAAMAEREEVSDAEISRVHDGLEADLARQVPEGLCKPGGAGERFYKTQVDALALP